MLFSLRELDLIIIIFSIVIGYQLSIYFFVQFYKYRKKKLVYNKILLAYGQLIALALTSYFILMIRKFFILDLNLFEIIYKFGFFLLLIAILLFLLIILSKSFHEILNPLIIKILIILIVIVIIGLVFIKTTAFEFIFLFFAASIGGFYIIVFQIKLVKQTTGKIKKRQILFTIGLFISVFGTILANAVILQLFQTNIYIISILLILIGIILGFIGVYNFPAFLEFQWKANLQKLYIFEQKNYKILYWYDFLRINDHNYVLNNSPSHEITKERILFSRGISGIDQIITQITSYREEKINKIEHGDSFIFLEYGDEPLSSITYALIVKKDMFSMRYFLMNVKKQFQTIYSGFLTNINIIDGIEDKLFSSFDNDLKMILE